MRNFGYYVREGIRNMFSHGFMSFAAVGITVACLVIMGTFTLVAVNLNENLKDLERENEILAFVDDTYTEEAARALQTEIEKVPNVREVKFITRVQAMEAFQKEHPDEDLYKNLDPMIFRDRYAIRVESLQEFLAMRRAGLRHSALGDGRRLRHQRESHQEDRQHVPRPRARTARSVAD
jgi:cell division transport system permease protein